MQIIVILIMISKVSVEHRNLEAGRGERGGGGELSHYGRGCAPAYFLSLDEGIFR